MSYVMTQKLNYTERCKDLNLCPSAGICVLETDSGRYLVIQRNPFSHLHSIFLWVIIICIIEFPS